MHITASDDPTTGAALRSDAVGQSQPLGSFRPYSRSGPVVVTLDVINEPVVILRTNPYGTVEVLPLDGPVLMLSGDTSATPVTDPVQCAEFLRLAVAELAAEARAQDAALDRARAEQYAMKRRHSALLADFRGHAIGWHNAGSIRRDELDTFLHGFELAAYEPRVRISYRITGSYKVRTADVTSAFRDAEGFLAADLSRVSHVVPGSHHLETVQATGANAVDALARTDQAAGQSETRVDFVITSTYEVDTADAARAARDAQQHLGVTLDSIDGVVEGSTKVDLDSDAAVVND